jgi:signal transduction histidine kinase
VTIHAANDPTLTLTQEDQAREHSLTPYLEVLQMPKAACVSDLKLEEIQDKNFTGTFVPLSAADLGQSVHWLRFSLRNLDSTHQEFTLSITFTDDIQLYLPDATGRFRVKTAGDTVIFTKREVAVGQMSFLRCSIPYGKPVTAYLRLESLSSISQQFKGPALQSLKLYPAPAFNTRFVTSRYFQAMFFGALLIMLFYNLFIYFNLRQGSYLYFSCFILFLLLFLAADRGYILELMLPDYPRLDQYIRFISAPLLCVAYIQFSRTYLRASQHAPVLDRYLRWLILLLAGIVLLMLAGFWSQARTLSISATLTSLLLILFLAVYSLLKGYTPARYFVAADILFLVGAFLFAYQRIHYIQHPFSQYGLQISALIQVALFSMGLTDRIQLMQKELNERILEKQRLEKAAVLERQRLIEEKNRELETKVKERTAEVLAQKEEIETQNERLAQVNEELVSTQEIIAKQNKELEETVQQRTQELYFSNQKLSQAIHELDSFIYRTAHDIRGPLARLMGLCYIAKMDVKEAIARDYLDKLNSQAYNLDYLLTRLSTVYEINHSQVKPQRIDFNQLQADLQTKLPFMKNYEHIRFQVEMEKGLICCSDYDLLFFIICNLLENAIKFQKQSYLPGVVLLKIRSRTDRLVIDVIDNGIGIRPEEASLIFDMFSRAAGKHKSAGMGLYMVKKGVEKLGGQVTLADHPTGLTNFRIDIPQQLDPLRSEVQKSLSA